MKVTFRCKQSGNTVSFADETDIAMMRKEENYEEVLEGPEHAMQQEAQEQEVSKANAAPVMPRRRGRPPKNAGQVFAVQPEP